MNTDAPAGGWHPVTVNLNSQGRAVVEHALGYRPPAVAVKVRLPGLSVAISWVQRDLFTIRVLRQCAAPPFLPVWIAHTGVLTFLWAAE